MPMSVENRARAAERMRKISSERWSARRSAAEVAVVDVKADESSVAVLTQPIEVVSPPRIGVRDLRIRVRTDGTMAALDGPCLCGKAKRGWHAICLRGDSHG